MSFSLNPFRGHSDDLADHDLRPQYAESLDARQRSVVDTVVDAVHEIALEFDGHIDVQADGHVGPEASGSDYVQIRISGLHPERDRAALNPQEAVAASATAEQDPRYAPLSEGGVPGAYVKEHAEVFDARQAESAEDEPARQEDPGAPQEAPPVHDREQSPPTPAAPAGAASLESSEANEGAAPESPAQAPGAQSGSTQDPGVGDVSGAAVAETPPEGASEAPPSAQQQGYGQQ